MSHEKNYVGIVCPDGCVRNFPLSAFRIGEGFRVYEFGIVGGIQVKLLKIVHCEVFNGNRMVAECENGKETVVFYPRFISTSKVFSDLLMITTFNDEFFLTPSIIYLP